MKNSMGSINIGNKPEDRRSLGFLELGDTVSIKKLTHRWSEPKPSDPKAPWIENGSAQVEAGKGELFCLVSLGSFRAGSPLTEEEIEKRMNNLGWFRRDNG